MGVAVTFGLRQLQVSFRNTVVHILKRKFQIRLFFITGDCVYRDKQDSRNDCCRHNKSKQDNRFDRFF